MPGDKHIISKISIKNDLHKKKKWHIFGRCKSNQMWSARQGKAQDNVNRKEGIMGTIQERPFDPHWIRCPCYDVKGGGGVELTWGQLPWKQRASIEIGRIAFQMETFDAIKLNFRPTRQMKERTGLHNVAKVTKTATTWWERIHTKWQPHAAMACHARHAKGDIDTPEGCNVGWPAEYGHLLPSVTVKCKPGLTWGSSSSFLDDPRVGPTQ